MRARRLAERPERRQFREAIARKNGPRRTMGTAIRRGGRATGAPGRSGTPAPVRTSAPALQDRRSGSRPALASFSSGDSNDGNGGDEDADGGDANRGGGRGHSRGRNRPRNPAARGILAAEADAEAEGAAEERDVSAGRSDWRPPARPRPRLSRCRRYPRCRRPHFAQPAFRRRHRLLLPGRPSRPAPKNCTLLPSPAPGTKHQPE
jgi:hypothetical protein